jgi:alkanesulfonate monooxygenase SsuD/methylene tetrahydromethanopterin reductase-like flavin-dependent oxidoreductase (luciferase family)
VTHTVARFNLATGDDSDRGRLWRDALDLCEALDGGGIDELTFSEHHETPSRSCTSPLLAAAGALGRTDRCTVSASAVLVALHDPVRLAEDVAFLDVAHPGRLRVVAGLGYRPVEYERFGRDFARRGALMDEALEAILDVWEGTVGPATPVDQLLAVGGQSVAAARRAARVGLPFAPRAHLPDLAATYEALAGAEATVWMPSARFLQVHVADDPDAAWARVGRWYLEDARDYARWQVPDGGPTSPVFTAAEHADELRASGAVAVLTPAQCVAAIAEPDTTVCLHPLAGGMPTSEAWASVELFVNQVLPKIDPAGGSPRA